MGRQHDRQSHETVEPVAGVTTMSGNSSRGDAREREAVDTGRGRPLTDGGWNRGIDEAGDDKSDGDPFIWGADDDGPDADTRGTNEPDDTRERPDTGSRDARPNGGAVQPDTGGSAPRRGIDEPTDRRRYDGRPADEPVVAPATRNQPAGPPPGAPTEEGAVPEAVEEVAKQLERLETVAEELTVDTINANIKRVQGATDELKSVHDDLEAHARAVERTVGCLEDRLEEIREAFTRRHRERRAARPEPPGRNQPTAPASQRPAGRFDPARPTPPRATGSDGGLVLDDLPTPDAASDEGGTDTPDEPVEFLIPGTELRDMWRVRSRPGDGPLGGTPTERWILETSPRMVDSEDGPPEDRFDIPPEVAEFTLDPDEMSFDDLLGLVRDDD